MDMVRSKGLCAVCSEIDFALYFRQEVHKDTSGDQFNFFAASKEALRLGKFADIVLKGSSCAFCHLVAMAVKNKLSFLPHLQTLVLPDENTMCWIYSYLCAEAEQPGLEPIKAYRISVATRLDDHGPSAADQAGDIQLLADDAARIGLSPLFHGREVARTRANMPLAQKWFKLCEEDHGLRCSSPSVKGKPIAVIPAPEQILAIDVEKMCILTLPRGARYVALSYYLAARVRGEPNMIFPTWSWAGWASSVNVDTYFKITALYVDMDWYVIYPSGTVIRLDTARPNTWVDFSTGANKDTKPPGQPPRSFISAIQPRSLVNTSEQRWKYPSFLACWSMVASLTLTGEEQPLQNQFIRRWRVICNAKISDKKGNWVGSILMHPFWVSDEVESPRQFLFMLMSRSKALMANKFEDLSVLYDETLFAKRPWCLLNVMMINVLNPEGDVAQRLGVGFIHEDAWVEADPQPRLMKLM